MEKIENEYLSAEFINKGAEMVSLKDKTTQKDILWEGNPKWWDGHAPILFPCTGALWNDTYRINGKKNHLPKHGFAKNNDWKVIKKEKSQITYEYIPTEQDRKDYPFDYTLQTTYCVEGKTLRAQFSVKNNGEETLYFQLGGHPAIKLPDFKEEKEEVCGYLEFEGEPDHLLRAGEQGCIVPERFPITWEEKTIAPICVPTFATEALIFDERQVKSAKVLDLQKKAIVKVTSDAPVWLFWQPQGIHSPFVCCEPWYGLPDNLHFEGELSQRPNIQKAEKGSSWQGYYAVEVLS